MSTKVQIVVGQGPRSTTKVSRMGVTALGHFLRYFMWEHHLVVPHEQEAHYLFIPSARTAMIMSGEDFQEFAVPPGQDWKPMLLHEAAGQALTDVFGTDWALNFGTWCAEEVHIEGTEDAVMLEITGLYLRPDDRLPRK